MIRRSDSQQRYDVVQSIYALERVGQGPVLELARETVPARVPVLVREPVPERGLVLVPEREQAQVLEQGQRN